jgi:hypothetical protein
VAQGVAPGFKPHHHKKKKKKKKKKTTTCPENRITEEFLP